ncbi:MAG: hypothetical protein KAG56_10545 [Sulfurovaceae bacterium]|nr:hypothetical protein [Sulfurovaceae bacterium]
MTTILMILMFPIGIYTYFFIEKKDKKVYQSVFDDFQQSISKSTKFSKEEKIERFQQMLRQNGYEVITVTKSSVLGQKKILSMGLILIGLGIYIVGIFFYLAYFFWFQKPHKVEFHIDLKTI